jgi:hypothetical protein
MNRSERRSKLKGGYNHAPFIKRTNDPILEAITVEVSGTSVNGSEQARRLT